MQKKAFFIYGEWWVLDEMLMNWYNLLYTYSEWIFYFKFEQFEENSWQPKVTWKLMLQVCSSLRVAIGYVWAVWGKFLTAKSDMETNASSLL